MANAKTITYAIHTNTCQRISATRVQTGGAPFSGVPGEGDHLNTTGCTRQDNGKAGNRPCVFSQMQSTVLFCGKMLELKLCLIWINILNECMRSLLIYLRQTNSAVLWRYWRFCYSCRSKEYFRVASLLLTGFLEKRRKCPSALSPSLKSKKSMYTRPKYR